MLFVFPPKLKKRLKPGDHLFVCWSSQCGLGVGEGGVPCITWVRHMNLWCQYHFDESPEGYFWSSCEKDLRRINMMKWQIIPQIYCFLPSDLSSQLYQQLVIEGFSPWAKMTEGLEAGTSEVISLVKHQYPPALPCCNKLYFRAKPALCAGRLWFSWKNLRGGKERFRGPDLVLFVPS